MGLRYEHDGTVCRHEFVPHELGREPVRLNVQLALQREAEASVMAQRTRTSLSPVSWDAESYVQKCSLFVRLHGDICSCICTLSHEPSATQ